MKTLMDKYLVERRYSREIEGDELDWGLTSDGWDDRELERQAHVIKFTDRVARIAYELENARRNSYAKFGDTVADLAREFENISKEAKKIASDLKRNA